MNNEFENNLRFLFSRMTWPTMLVRERACESIATLLVDPQYNPIVKKELKNWIKSQRLESVAALGLLVLLRAKIIDEKFNLIPYRELLKNISKPSALTYWLLKELGYNKVLSPNWEKLCIPDTPKHFVPNPFFEKYCISFLPPIYKSHAIDISQKCSIPFIQHWAYEWDNILKDMNKRPSPEPLHFRGNKKIYIMAL